MIYRCNNSFFNLNKVVHATIVDCTIQVEFAPVGVASLFLNFETEAEAKECFEDIYNKMSPKVHEDNHIGFNILESYL